MIAALIGVAVVVALLGLILLAAGLEVPDKTVGGLGRPGGDEQWGGQDWQATVPNIRRRAEEERLADQELAWHPVSRDAPAPARFYDRFPLRAPGSLFPRDTTVHGKHRHP